MISSIDASRPKVRKFGILFGCIGLLVAAYGGWKGLATGPWWGAAGVLCIIAAFAGYRLLRPLYIGWMAFAFVLGWVNTRLILGIFFYLILTPIGLILRLTGKDLLDRRIDHQASSYWVKRDPTLFDPRRCERLF